MDTPIVEWSENATNPNLLFNRYSAYFCLATIDRYYKKDMTQEEARELMLQCVDVLKMRFLVNMPNFEIKVVTRGEDGEPSITSEIVRPRVYNGVNKEE